jgi:hypothetical protein
MSEESGANQEKEPRESGSNKMTPETRESIEILMKDMIEGGHWGYKNKTDPAEREVAFQSEAMAEKLFAHLYADDPENAKVKWEKYSGKPADKGLISRAESISLEPAEKSVERLGSEQKKILDAVDKYVVQNQRRQREKDISNMRIAIGDSKQRQRDFRRRATDQIFQEQKEADGLTVVKAFFKGATRVADDYIASWRERGKVKEIGSAMKEMTSGFTGEKSQIFQAIRGSSIGGQAGARSSAFGSAGAAGMAAGFAAAKMMSDIIGKMTGRSKQDATANAPEPVKMLLLPPPAKMLPPPDRGMDGGMGPGMAPA